MNRATRCTTCFSALALVSCLSNSNGPPTGGSDASDSTDASSDAGPTTGTSDSGANDGASAASGADGLYFGALGDGGAGNQVAVLVTGTAYWIWQYGAGTVGAGAVGVATVSASTLTTSQASASTAAVQATYAPGASMSGTIGTGASAAAFQTAYAASYGSPASLGAVVGAWPSYVYSGGFGTETEVITVGSSGALTMTNPLGCTGIGTIAPDPAHGFYAVSVTFQGGTCIDGTQTLTGVAVLDATNPAAPQLLTWIVTSARDGGFPTSGSPSLDGG
jgi:hypothetical protein